MTTFATSALSDVLPTIFVQAAEAPLMAARMAEALVAITDAAAGNIIGITLAGAGDGHTFVTSVDTSTDPIGAGFLESDEVRIGCYLAANAEALTVARATVLAELLAEAPPFQGAALNFVDEQLVGATKGTRFMGMIVALWIGQA